MRENLALTISQSEGYLLLFEYLINMKILLAAVVAIVLFAPLTLAKER